MNGSKYIFVEDSDVPTYTEEEYFWYLLSTYESDKFYFDKNTKKAQVLPQKINNE